MKPKTCKVCKKRQLITIKCKCNKTFCLKHRLPSQHDCKFDYKKMGQEQLKEECKDAIPIKINQL